MSENIITVKNLRKIYKTHKRKEGVLNAVKSLFSRKYEYKQALKGISFEIKKGEIVGFIGPNGAGKSTTIKTLSGFLYPTSGEVKVMNYVPWEDRKEYVEHLGVVLGQKETLWWDLPAVDSFYLAKDLYGIPETTFQKRLKYMTRILDVEKVMNTPVRDMSLGERMKCKLIAALLHNPAVVLLDEPSIGLDVVAKDKFRDFIKTVNRKEGTTFIITTHDMQEIEKLCKDVIIINHGIIVYNGSIKEIKKKFLTTKFIEVKLEEKGKKFRLRNCTVVDNSDYEFTISVDTSKRTKVKDVVDHLIANYEVADIVITDPPIEEVIQKIFKSRGKVDVGTK